jgi:hypothetical protein
MDDVLVFDSQIPATQRTHINQERGPMLLKQRREDPFSELVGVAEYRKSLFRCIT